MKVLGKNVIKNLCLDPDPDWIQIQIGSRFNNSLDQNPNSANLLDPDLDSVNLDPKQ